MDRRTKRCRPTCRSRADDFARIQDQTAAIRRRGIIASGNGETSRASRFGASDFPDSAILRPAYPDRMSCRFRLSEAADPVAYDVRCLSGFGRLAGYRSWISRTARALIVVPIRPRWGASKRSGWQRKRTLPATCLPGADRAIIILDGQLRQPDPRWIIGGLEGLPRISTVPVFNQFAILMRLAAGKALMVPIWNTWSPGRGCGATSRSLCLTGRGLQGHPSQANARRCSRRRAASNYCIVEDRWHEFPRVAFIVTNLSRPAERVTKFYNGSQERDQLDAAVDAVARRQLRESHESTGR